MGFVALSPSVNGRGKFSQDGGGKLGHLSKPHYGEADLCKILLHMIKPREGKIELLAGTA